MRDDRTIDLYARGGKGGDDEVEEERSVSEREGEGEGEGEEREAERVGLAVGGCPSSQFVLCILVPD
jgi:hypothetical protein